MKTSNLRRITCLVLAFLLVLSIVQPLHAWAEGTDTVYFDPVNGSDNNNGLSASAPVKTLKTAYGALPTGGTIVFLSNHTVTASTLFPKHDYPITLTSATGAEGIIASANLRMQTDTTFKNITLTFNNSSMMMVSGEGNDLTIESDVTVVRETTSQVNLVATKRYNADCTANPTLTVRAGNWNYIYATHGNDITGDITVLVEGGTCKYISPCYNGVVTGNVNISVSNATVSTSVYLKPTNANGSITGNLNITLGENADIAKTATSSGTIQGAANVILQGSTDGQLVGTGAGSNLILQSGEFAGTVSGFGSVAIDVPAGKTLTLSGIVEADTVKCAGTLNFEGTGSLTAKAVTGTVNCTITGEVKKNNVFITAPANADIRFPAEYGVVGENGQYMVRDLENFQGLVLRADSDLPIKLYAGHEYSSKDTPLTPDYTEVVGEKTLYYYAGITGNYLCRISKTGHYTYNRLIHMSEQEASTKTVEDVAAVPMAGTGWEDSSIYIRTSEATASFRDTSELWWDNYVPQLDTPAFTNPDRGAHQSTTQSEMEQYIADLDDADDDMYVFSMGTTTTYEQNLPLVIFTKTDLTGVQTLEEAAQLLKASGKPNMEYRAQMHGNEPASGEGALNVIRDMDGEYGDGITDNINVYIIPRLNPDGAKDGIRTLSTGVDPNRDLLGLETKEMQLHQEVCRIMDPVMIIDGHEQNYYRYLGDMVIGIGYTVHNSAQFRDESLKIAYQIFDNLDAQELSAYWYQSNVNTTDSNLSRAYSANAAVPFILLESLGIDLGLQAYENRVTCHVIAAETIITYVAENADQMVKVMTDEKNRFITTGATYEEDDVISLSTGRVKDETYAITADVYDLGSGTVTPTLMTPYIYTNSKRTRVAPTAYVVPASLERIDDILTLMYRQNIRYSYLPKNATLNLQQYYGTMSEAFLTEEKAVTFNDGAYVFPMNQSTKIILAMLMEPDANDVNDGSYSGGLVKQGMTPADANGYYPIYRYITDLNASGTVDYAVAPAAPEGLTSSNGVISGLDATKLYEYRSATGTTYTAVPAGATQITGLSIGVWHIRYQAVGDTIASADTICYVGHDTIYVSAATGSDSNTGSSQSEPVATLEAAYALLNAGVDGSVANAAGTIILLDNYEIASATAYSLPAHRFTVTIKGMTPNVKFSFAPSGNSGDRTLYFNGPTVLDDLNMVYGYSGTKYAYICANGNKLVIEDGITTTANNKDVYMNLVGGHYSNGVAQTDMTIKAGTWRNIYADGYKGTHTGKVTLVMENCVVTHQIQNALSGTSTGDTEFRLTNVSATSIFCGNASTGNLNGDMTLVLGEGVTVSSSVSTGGRDGGSMNGTVTIVADGADLSAITLINGLTAADATGTVNKGVLVYASGTAIPKTGFDEVRIDTDSTVTLGADLAVDSVSGSGTVELNGYSLIGDIQVAAQIKTVSLRANAAGLYFGGSFDIQGLDAVYGIALSTEDETPVAQDNTTSLYTTGYNSVLVKDIMKTGNAENSKNAGMKVYARAYVKLSDGTIIYGTAVAVTLKQLVTAVDAQWDTLTTAQQAALKTMYEAFTTDMKAWQIPNIKNA